MASAGSFLRNLAVFHRHFLCRNLANASNGIGPDGCYNGGRLHAPLLAPPADMPDDSLADTFANRNRRTQAQWAAFAAHREQITRILQQHAPRAASLCVLGAGNCTDLDLPRLAGRFSDVLLVDLDAEAVASGVRSQFREASTGVRCLAGDVTKVYTIFDDLIHGRSRLEQRIDELNEQLARPPVLTSAEENFDCVLSSCLLSQLIDAVGLAVPQKDPRYLELVLAVRRQHIATLLGLLRPGGTLILLTDFVSSVTCPDLAALPDDQLPRYAAQQIAAGNFFTGLKPQAVSEALTKMLPPGSPAPLLLRPWKWNLGPRLYLVTAHIAHPADAHSQAAG